ncbi:MAG: hypothetical protein H6668_02375 [Ardenticatenaceae bacterium]|nr:hypothetical protein [Ardenticatenaceae bacterium]
MHRIYTINDHLRQLFPDGESPFQMVARLAEECGELAAQVNHFEGSGVKRHKHGEPDRAKLAKEVQDVLRCALQIAAYYRLEAELDAAIEARYQQALSALAKKE